jgi:hypothetical protein
MVTVADGVVTVTGAPETADLGRNLMNRIRHVAGVVAVRDELSWPLPERSIASVLLLIRQLTGDHRR